jgi:peptidoglycan hydrolase-like protein with peptidoglycan-binding domain
MAQSISRSVGRNGVNSRMDVETIQRLINANIGKISPTPPLVVDGRVGPKTISAIEQFQKRVVGLSFPDGRVDPNGRTLTALNAGGGGSAPPPVSPPPVPGVFSHPDAGKVVLTYGIQGDGKQVVKMNHKAEYLLKSIVASVGVRGARLTSTLRTYHDQARITVTQTYVASPSKVATWYGQAVLDECERRLNDIEGFAKWWQEYDRKRGRFSSKHLTNRALDVVPDGDRAKFAAKVQELVPVKGSGVARIIPKGVMGEPVDHVEFTFDVCDI